MVFTTNQAPGVYIVPGAQIQAAQASIVSLVSAVIGSTATGGTANTPTPITSVVDLLTKFPGVPIAVQNYIQAIYSRYAGVNLQYVRMVDSGGSPTTRTHLVQGCAALANLDIVPTLIALPESPGLATSADITTVFNALDALCQATRFVGVFDCAAVTLTNAAAIAESDAYRAAKRHVGLHYGAFRVGANTIPPSAIVIADQLRAIAEFGQFVSAANKYSISNDLTPILGRQDQEALAAKQVNVLRNVPGFGNALYDDLLLATGAGEPRQYISLIVDKVVDASLNRAIALFRTLDPGRRTTASITAVLTNLMDDLADAGAFKAATLSDGTVLDRGYLVGGTISSGDQTATDVIYAPVTSLRQAVIRSTRVMA